MDIHNTQLRLFNTLIGIQLRCCQYIAAAGTEIIDTLVECNEVNGNIPLTHEPSGMVAAACGVAPDDLNVVETEDRAGIAVTEG